LIPKPWKKQNGNLTLCKSAEEALQDADALIVITEWNVFRSPDFDKIKSILTEPVIFDGKNIYDSAMMKTNGFHYYSIGRQKT